MIECQRCAWSRASPASELLSAPNARRSHSDASVPPSAARVREANGHPSENWTHVNSIDWTFSLELCTGTFRQLRQFALEVEKCLT
jgi:hypothetical protein